MNKNQNTTSHTNQNSKEVSELDLKDSKERLQLLYCLRFFQKKSMNGGLNAYEMVALQNLKNKIKKLDISYTKDELKNIPSLDAKSYLGIMSEFSKGAGSGLLISFELSGDIDQDLKDIEWLLDKVKTTMVYEIKNPNFKVEKVNTYWAIENRQLLDNDNTLVVVQPNVDNFSVVMAKYLILLRNQLKSFEPKRPKKRELPQATETPNSVDKHIHKDKMMIPHGIPFNKEAQITSPTQDDAKTKDLEQPQTPCCHTYQWVNVENGMMALLDYRGLFYEF